ncbi:MAG: universal stress protein [Desulfobacterales bacterium]
MIEKPSLIRPVIRRILVALDASPASRSTIQTAVDLASRFDAEVVGLFVEDVDLLRVASLPFVREVGAFSLLARKLDYDVMQRQLRAQAEQMRRALATAAEVHGVTWEFLVKRGAVTAEVMTAGANADLMIIGRAGRALTARRRMGSTVRTMVLQRPGLTFILTTTLQPTHPVIFLYDGSVAGEKALEIAGSLVEVQDRRLTVITVAESRDEAEELRETALLRLTDFSLAGDSHILIRPDRARIAWLVRMSGRGPVILPCGKERLQGEQLCSLLDEIPNPILLVR